MPTSGVTDWTLTARDVVNAAVRDELGIYPMGEEIPAEDMALGIFQLNALLQSLRDGAHLLTEGTVTVPANDPSGTLASNVREVISARFVSTYERLLTRFERDEYMSIPNKAASGEPTCFYVSSQLAVVTLYLWPVPTTNSTVKIDYQRRVEMVTGASETIDFPEEYQGMLVANLARRMAGRYGRAADLPELFMRAETLLQEFNDDQRPASYMLGPY
jgi:hypothetical protein